jgi:hypothetical protein
MIQTKLPPCLANVLENKNYLERYYYLIIRYVHEHAPELLPEVYKMLADIGIKIDPALDLFSKFKCADAKELCSDECPIRLDKFELLKRRTREVKLIKMLDGDAYLLVTIDDREVRVDLDPDRMVSSFVKDYAIKFGEFLDIDRRRKEDRSKWSELMNYWLSMAEEVSEVQYEESSGLDSDNLRIREFATNYLCTRMLVKKPSEPEEWDTFLVRSDVAMYDGEYAYFPRDELLKALAREGLKVSATKLSRCLRGFADVVRMKVMGRRISFYRFKPTESQVASFEENKIEEVEHES